MLQYFDDPKERERSVMLKAKRLCNGEQTGKQCVHYWCFAAPMDVMNPGDLTLGEKSRQCVLLRPEKFDLGEGGSDMPVICNCYEPSGRAYDAEFEKPHIPAAATDPAGPEPTQESK